VPLRVLIADDSEVMRMGMRTLVGMKQGWQVCGEAANGDEAIAMVLDRAPDVIILDLTMPGKNGFEAASEIRRIAPSTKIVFYSVHDVPAAAKEVGGDAFVSKANAAEELLAAIERVVSLPNQTRTKIKSA
jgi:DNA-binding NarL/FixJ family response regulator